MREPQVDIRLVPMALEPFTQGASKNCKCRCVHHDDWDLEEDERPDPKCDWCKGKGAYDREPCQRDTSRDDRIKRDAYYLVRLPHANVHGEYYWRAGGFHEVPHGWLFDAGSHLIQLNHIEGPIYEIIKEDL